MGYIVPQDLADYVGTPLEQDTGLLQHAIAGATKKIDLHCRRTFAVNDGTATARTYAVKATNLVHVDDFADVTGLVVRTDDDDDGAFETTWLAAEYELTPLGARMPDGSAGVYYMLRGVDTRAFPAHAKRLGVLQVTARWGWPEVPAGVVTASLELAKDLYSARLNRSGALVTDVGVVSVRRNTVAADALQPYVRTDRSGAS